jgi:hypothetical protein
MGAIGECIALNETQREVLKEIQDKKAETISRLARVKMEIMWDLQVLKLHLEARAESGKASFWQPPTAVLLRPPQGPKVPRRNVSVFLKLCYSFFFFYSYVHTRLGSFLPPAPTPSLTTHSTPSLSPPSFFNH